MFKKLFAAVISLVMLISVCPIQASADVSFADTSINVGDVVILGTYEQDGKKQNGAEEIEWIVLDKKDSQYLIVSRYVLAGEKYNNDKEKITWEKCDLRAWLNDDFISTAFTDKEQSVILTTELENEDNPKNGTSGGLSTKDKVFILSESEVEYYMPEKADRFCTATAYAQKQGVYSNKDNGGGAWWSLRTPGIYTSYVSYVSSGGGINTDGRDVNEAKIGVRPAMWIELAPYKSNAGGNIGTGNVELYDVPHVLF